MAHLLQLTKKINTERNTTCVKKKYMDILGSAATFWGTSHAEEYPVKISF